jgi:DUF971 family protein
VTGPARAPEPMVEELRLNRAERRLEVTFADGHRRAFAAEFLRVESPSAEVQGHGPGQRVTVSGKAKVGISGLEPVGNYAVRILFDDGHDTGIYSWTYLRELDDEYDSRWGAYLKALTDGGLSREVS